MPPIFQAVHVLYKRFQKSEIPVRAAALAFHSILSIIPVVALSFLYLRKLGVTQKWSDITKNFVLSHFNVQSGSVVIEHLDKLTTTASTKSTSIVGIAILAYTAFSLIIKFSDSLDTILGTAHEKPSLKPKFIKIFIKRCFTLTGIPVAVVFSLIVTTWIRHAPFLKEAFKIKFIGPFLALPLSWVVNIVVVSLVYYLIPRNKVSMRESIRAAFMVVPILEVGKFLVGLYNSHAISVQKLYGALAALPLFIFWVQISWMILLSGALFIRQPEEHAPHA